MYSGTLPSSSSAPVSPSSPACPSVSAGSVPSSSSTSLSSHGARIYSNIERKEKKIYTMKRVYSKLHCLFIVDIFIDYCQNKKFWSVSAGSTYTVKWYFQTPRNQGVPAPWDSLLIFSIGSRQDFSKELALCKIQQERHWEAIKTEQFKVFLAFFFLFQSRRVTIPLLHMCIRWRLKSHNVSQLFV